MMRFTMKGWRAGFDPLRAESAIAGSKGAGRALSDRKESFIRLFPRQSGSKKIGRPENWNPRERD
jgi:hypothetical protein